MVVMLLLLFFVTGEKIVNSFVIQILHFQYKKSSHFKISQYQRFVFMRCSIPKGSFCFARF